MPIGDVPPYEAGHFRRVYEHIIKPACAKAGFEPVRADEVERTNLIILDVLRRILKADVVLCDLSGRNPNVMYELGIRQAFNKPVVLIKDSQTDRVFDIQGLRDIEYDATLRIDRTNAAVTAIASSLTNTADGDQQEVNSLIQLLGVQAATVPQRTEISGETGLILNALTDIGKRLGNLEQASAPARPPAKPPKVNTDFDDFPGALSEYTVGGTVRNAKLGQGTVLEIKDGVVTARFKAGVKKFKDGDPEYDDLPF
jgi:hypothetical protein